LGTLPQDLIASGGPELLARKAPLPFFEYFSFVFNPWPVSFSGRWVRLGKELIARVLGAPPSPGINPHGEVGHFHERC